MTNTIKAILFDLDGTLRHNQPSGDQVFMEFTRGLGLNFTEEEQARAQRWEHHYFANSLEIQSDKQVFADPGEFWVNFSRRRLVALGLHEAQAAGLAPRASAHMAEQYKPQAHVPADVFPLLASVRECGYVLGVVSNRDEPYQDELKDLKLDPYFDFALAAGEVNSFKPDPRIFEHALERSGTGAHETLYVGDNYFADILGSRRAGLVPVLFDPGGLFPEANCAVISSFRELPGLLM
jgi:HAD superfamily hydrolase (TIGR01549 family)